MLLVTGITGRSGQYFLEEMIKKKYKGPIRCIVRVDSDTSRLDQTDLRIEKVVGELTDPVFLDHVLEGVDTVLHIASIYYSTNLVRGILKHPQVKRVILVHTTGIYSKYKSAAIEYKRMEDEIHDMLRKGHTDLGVIILRPTMIYGSVRDNNMIHFIRWIDQYRVFPIINRGKSLLQPVHAKDLGCAYYQVVTNDHINEGEYILSGSQVVSIRVLFQMISFWLGKKTIFVSVPLCLALGFAWPIKWLTLGRVDIVEKLQRMGEDRSFSHEVATKDFGYAPMLLEDGLVSEIKEFLAIRQKSQRIT
jgi:nucleoside-diphosphate-sugar epimerase